MTDKRHSRQDGQEKSSCGVNASGSALTLSKQQQDALCIMRCFFVSYARPQSVDWEVGMNSAVKAFGEDKGPKVAWCCLRAVQAMRVSRRTRFHFCDPFCPCCCKRLTVNEGHLMRSLQAVSQGRRGEAELASMMLCEGNPDAAFLAAVERLSAELSH